MKSKEYDEAVDKVVKDIKKALDEAKQERVKLDATIQAVEDILQVLVVHFQDTREDTFS